MKRLFVLGIDGGTFDIINPLIEKGELPNMKKLIEKGASSLFYSITPPLTALVWGSLQTGCNPGKHGIYDFCLLDENWKSRFINSKELKEKPFWLFLSDRGIKSVIVDCPLTYPVYKMDGIIVSGIETPSEMHTYTYPLELKKELNDIGYVIEPNTYQKNEEEIRKIITNSFEKRIETAKMLLKKEWRFFLFFIRESDILQHYFWNGEQVEELYKKIDSFLGFLMEQDFDLIVFSDHGFEKLHKAININSLLVKEGYLALKGEEKGLVDKKKARKIIDSIGLTWLTRIVPRSFKKFLKEDVGFEEAIAKDLIDWSRTRAITRRSVKTINVILNTKERSSRGIVEEKDYNKLRDEIILKIKKLFEKERINAEIWKREELYSGNRLKDAPDIIIYLPKGYEANSLIFSDSIYANLAERTIAEHNREGIFITKSKLKLKDKPGVMDFAPTILNYFSVPIPSHMDGKRIF